MPPTPDRPPRLLPATGLAGLLVAALAAAAAAQAPAALTGPTAAPAAIAEQLDALFAAAYPAEGPGAAVVAIAGGDTVLRRGYGMACLELGVPIAPDMVFRIGSVTKQLTAATALLLAADGALDLDARVAAYLPDYAGPGAGATVAQLLGHTAGVPNYTSVPEFWQQVCDPTAPERLLGFVADRPADFPPGESFAYSNTGYALLGAILERVSGLPYGELVEKSIFGPLGMTSSRYGEAGGIVPRRVAGYRGAAGSWQPAAPLDVTQAFAAGGLLSTVDDLARWNAALDDDRLLPEAWRRRMWEPGRLPDGRSTHYGFGWSVWDYEGHRVQEHGGEINGFAAHLVRLPGDGVFVAVLSNAPGSTATELALEAALRLAGLELAERPAVPVAVERLAALAGVYGALDDPAPWTVELAGGGLRARQGNDGPWQELRALDAGELFFPRPERALRLRFQGDPVEAVVVVNRSGPDQRLPRRR
jgi:CubicO group peptidase (beta-lactamase class C family)